MYSKKSKSGEGDTLAITFLGRDAQELKALEMSKRLARRGRRTLYLLAILAALQDVFEHNGEVPEMVEIINAIHGLKVRQTVNGK